GLRKLKSRTTIIASLKSQNASDAYQIGDIEKIIEKAEGMEKIHDQFFLQNTICYERVYNTSLEWKPGINAERAIKCASG
uniref:Uncharacterized protein n=1 Tax=Romanomermis culicivorax TaxID=13658 RepID=A0A915K6E4_ROMCU